MAVGGTFRCIADNPGLSSGLDDGLTDEYSRILRQVAVRAAHLQRQIEDDAKWALGAVVGGAFLDKADI